MEWNVTLEQVVELLDPFTVVTLRCKRGIGYVITCGRFWVKTDGAKTKAHLKACGMRTTIRKRKGSYSGGKTAEEGGG